jgi:hypothetical protein
LNKLINTYLTSFKNLWNSRESLHFNHIRMKVLPLMLAMPLAVMVADMQYSFLGLQADFLGMDSSTVLQTMYSIGGFPDQKHIASWAVEATKYMSKLGIIKGDSQGNFMPKATTTAQQAAGYGTATREAAILMSVRTYETMQ